MFATGAHNSRRGARPRATMARAALTLSTGRSLRRGPRLDVQEIGARENGAYTRQSELITETCFGG